MDRQTILFLTCAPTLQEHSLATRYQETVERHFKFHVNIHETNDFRQGFDLEELVRGVLSCHRGKVKSPCNVSSRRKMRYVQMMPTAQEESWNIQKDRSA